MQQAVAAVEELLHVAASSAAVFDGDKCLLDKPDLGRTMLEYLRVGRKAAVTPKSIDPVTATVVASPHSPISLQSLNKLHDHVKQRVYRTLIPHGLLARFDIDPITWRGPDQSACVRLQAVNGSGAVSLQAWSIFDPGDPFFTLQLVDNAVNGVQLDWIILSDPAGERFDTDVTVDGRPTFFGTTSRNGIEEERAQLAGLAPGQVRHGLRGSAEVFRQIDTFLIALGHRSLTLEPLTYSSAWLFERRGFAYIAGHQLMKTIDEEFRPGGRLNGALDGSTPFRQPEQWQTVRGRAWAIHDGILEVLGKRWDGLRMIRQLGRDAGVSTFPDASY
ncbi:MAG: hypothetical protein PVH11_00605 [Anaerolineae bacterium]|jgi:hypothetical protein